VSPREQQSLEALEKGQAIRLQMACVKRALKADGSREGLIGALMDPDEYTERIKVFHVLLCGRRIGVQKARAMMRRAGVGESLRVGELTMRQRMVLCALLAGEEVPSAWPVAA
jgi:hypothetical protein